MNLKIADLMVKNVLTTEPHKTIGHVKSMMEKNKISAVPVVNSEEEPIGIVTSNDFKKPLNDRAPVSTLLSGGHVYKIPAYNDVSVAAKVMRKHKIHHLLVTHEQKLIGIITSYDLLKLIDGKRFVMKNPPSSKSR